MAIDPPTMLLVTLAIALIAAGFLAFEWRAIRDNALILWSAGFATIAAGCAISPLRESYSFIIGVWTANGLLILSHLFFLDGVARFIDRRITPLWWALLLPWAMLLGLPPGGDQMQIFGVLNSALVAVIALKAGLLLLAPGTGKRVAIANRMGFVFLLHGAWYCLKTGLIWVHGAYVDAVQFKGFAIQLSLFEGILVEVLLALLMAASVRRRREEEMAELAERDPLTGVFNRRAFEDRATIVLRRAAAERLPCALMLLDVDRFKTVNDNCGHAVGDRILIALANVLLPILPRGALLARIGGDEFALLVPGIEAAKARDFGEAICGSFASRCTVHGGLPVMPTVSIGAVLFTGGAELDDLMEVADASLYEAKHRGRNQLRSRSLKLETESAGTTPDAVLSLRFARSGSQ